MIARICFISILSSFAGAALLPLPGDQALEGWLLLFDGETTYGWSGSGWRPEGGSLVSDPSGDAFLLSNCVFADFALHFEARGSGAVLIRRDDSSKPAQPGYKVLLSDGSIVDIGPSSRQPVTGWNVFEIEARLNKVSVKLNGLVVAEGADGQNRIGGIALSAARGQRVEIKNVRVRPLELESIYNGRDLGNWKPVPPPPPKKDKRRLPIPLPLHFAKSTVKPATWTGEGTIRGKEGVGRLESALSYEDFILQVTVKTNPKSKNDHPLAGVFFRGVPGQFYSGYEARIHNEFGSVRSGQSKEVGTGGLFQVQPARVLVGEDGRFFTETIVARGRQISIWVDGLLVTDYHDSRPNGADASKGFQANPGPLGFSVAEPAVVDFRNVVVGTLPKGPTPAAPAVITAAGPATTTISPPQPSSATSTSPPQPSAPTATPVPPLQASPNFSGVPPEERERQAQLRQLTASALDAKDPRDAVAINSKILNLDPTNTTAQMRLDAARDLIKRDLAEKTGREQAQQEGLVRNQQLEQRKQDTKTQIEAALKRHDLGAADGLLSTLRQLDSGNPAVSKLDVLLRAARYDQWFRRITWGGGGILSMAAFLAILVKLRGKRTGYLILSDGIDKGKRYLIKDVVHVGAVAMDEGQRNEIVIRDHDRLVSRFHCEIHQRDGAYFVIDCNSANGTFVNGRQLDPGKAIRLRSGTKISVAKVALIEFLVQKATK
jgi:hypothetical protein